MTVIEFTLVGDPRVLPSGPAVEYVLFHELAREFPEASTDLVSEHTSGRGGETEEVCLVAVFGATEREGLSRSAREAAVALMSYGVMVSWEERTLGDERTGNGTPDR